MKERRKLRWIKKGYTEEQIDVHLSFERRQTKQSREKRKVNNEKNKEIILKIKKELINQTFDDGYVKCKVLSLRPSTDGVGFWLKVHKIFRDGSEGNFRYFQHFNGYELRSFIEYLKF